MLSTMPHSHRVQPARWLCTLLLSWGQGRPRDPVFPQSEPPSVSHLTRAVLDDHCP